MLAMMNSTSLWKEMVFSRVWAWSSSVGVRLRISWTSSLELVEFLLQTCRLSDIVRLQGSILSEVIDLLLLADALRLDALDLKVETLLEAALEGQAAQAAITVELPGRLGEVADEHRLERVLRLKADQKFVEYPLELHGGIR